MAHINWTDGVLDLSAVDGFTFTPAEPTLTREPITGPREIAVSITLTIPDDSPIYRWPLVLVANAPNN